MDETENLLLAYGLDATDLGSAPWSPTTGGGPDDASALFDDFAENLERLSRALRDFDRDERARSGGAERDAAEAAAPEAGRAEPSQSPVVPEAGSAAPAEETLPEKEPDLAGLIRTAPPEAPHGELTEPAGYRVLAAVIEFEPAQSSSDSDSDTGSGPNERLWAFGGAPERPAFRAPSARRDNLARCGCERGGASPRGNGEDDGNGEGDGDSDGDEDFDVGDMGDVEPRPNPGRGLLDFARPAS